MGVMQGAGQIMQHQEQGRAVGRRNRAKLKNFEEQNKQYKREVMLDNNEWKNEVQVQDIEQDQYYQAMIRQWSEQDQQLDKIFAQGDKKIEKAIVEMYENDYAGTGTGRTAARLAGKSAKKLGQYKSEVLHSMMMSKEDAQLNKESATASAQTQSWNAYEKIRFSPIHGHTPIAPELEAKPGMGGLLLSLGMTALGTAASAGAFKAPDTGLGLDSSILDKTGSGFSATDAAAMGSSKADIATWASGGFTETVIGGDGPITTRVLPSAPAAANTSAQAAHLNILSGWG